MNKYQHTDAESRILAVLSIMPYGALANIAMCGRRIGFRGTLPAPIDLDDVGAYLAALGEVIRHVAEQKQTEHEELIRLKSDIEATRRVLGCQPGGPAK